MRNYDEKLEACAAAAHEVERVYSEACGVSGTAWCEMHSAMRGQFLRNVERFLSDGLSCPYGDGTRNLLFLRTVRGMAAALGMKVTYPAAPWGGRPEAHTVDFGGEGILPPPNVRNEVLEEAAQLCDKHAAEYDASMNSPEIIAAAIRGLKRNT